MYLGLSCSISSFWCIVGRRGPNAFLSRRWYLVFPAPFVKKKTFLYPLNFLAPLSKVNWPGFISELLIYPIALDIHHMPVSYYLNYYGFLVNFEIRSGNPSFF